MRTRETPEQRKERLETQRQAYLRDIDKWASVVEYYAGRAAGQAHEFEEGALAIAAQVLRNAKIAQVKRAVAEINKLTRARWKVRGR